MADKVLEEFSQGQIINVDSNHYLYEFTDDELFEILMKPDEWGSIDYELSKKY
ncbi:hypothetical protein QQ008_13085 [Fulvivirgaceae bacterium BMA10]|uniref:Uncharacterized protein n=1 Tax=Splendidivirga corallicola TaxID=3051826 RepID=A0ABT8KQ70_9BACT|nr:hypothetical protein [Fulvivirgaceae bacterium BMA10]